VPDLKRQRTGCRGRGAEDRNDCEYKCGTRDVDNFAWRLRVHLCGERIIMSVRKQELSERWKKGKGKTRRPRVRCGWAMGEVFEATHEADSFFLID
jgi:hypothetical protein